MTRFTRRAPKPEVLTQARRRCRGISQGGEVATYAASVMARSSAHPSALLRPCLRPSGRVSTRSVPSKPPPAAPVAARGGFDGTERAGTRSDGRNQGRSSADGCGEDRVYKSVWMRGGRLPTPMNTAPRCVPERKPSLGLPGRVPGLIST